MRLVKGGTITIPVKGERTFKVDGSPCEATRNEWIVMQLEIGDDVAVRRYKREPHDIEVLRVTERAWIYDGLILGVGFVRERGTEREHVERAPAVHADFDDVMPLCREVVDA